MLQNLFSKFRGAGEREEASPPERQLETAVAALLVEAARADEEYTDQERQIIDDVLAAQFDLTPDVAATVRAAAEEAQAASNDMYTFSRVVKDELDHEAKVKLIEDMWAIVLSDDERAPYEEMIIRRLIGLIHVEDAESAKARQRAEARRAGG